MLARDNALVLEGRTRLMRVEATGAVLEVKFMLPWSFLERGGGREKYTAATQYVGDGHI